MAAADLAPGAAVGLGGGHDRWTHRDEALVALGGRGVLFALRTAGCTPGAAVSLASGEAPEAWRLEVSEGPQR